MRKLKQTICIIIVTAVLLSLINVTATAAASDFTVVDGVLTGYTGTGGDVVIPGNLGITEIGDYAFYLCASLMSISIPDGVTSIGEYVFTSCSNLTSITIPNSVLSIGDYSFVETSINSPILINNGQTLCYIPVSYASYEIPDTVTSINGCAFYNCSSLTTITIPDSVTSISNELFHSCTGLTSISIPNGVTSIGSYAFTNCRSLTSIVLPSSITSIGQGAFYYCSSLTAMTIPSNVTLISDGLFSKCDRLESVTLPSGITSIGQGAFNYCYELTSINLPESILAIGSYAFNYCSRLTSITIPSGVTSIGENTFYSCVGLTSITIPSGVTTIDDRAFEGCYNLSSVTIPTGVTWIGNYAFKGCDSLQSVTLPDGVTAIGASAFESCRGLESITIPDSVTLLGNLVFSNCISLQSITIPGSITEIPYGTFLGCERLTDVTIQSGVTTIGENAFIYCRSLVSLVFPDTVTTISVLACYNCSSLTSVFIPDSVTAIGYSAFNNCGSNLKINGYKDSYAETYAADNGIPFVTIGAAYTDYYASTTAKTFRIIDPTSATPVGGFSITVNSHTYNVGSGGYITVDIPNDYSGSVVISKTGYYTYTMPMGFISNNNTVTMIPNKGGSNPFVQSLLMWTSTANYSDFTNLRTGSASIYSGDTEKNVIMADINWNGNAAGTIWLEQDTVTVPLSNGANNIALGQYFTSDGGTIYICAQSGTNTTRVATKLTPAQKPQPTLNIDTGGALSFDTGSDNQVLPSTKLDMSLPGGFSLSLQVNSDGTFDGVFGIKAESKDTAKAKGCIKDAISKYNQGLFSPKEAFDHASDKLTALFGGKYLPQPSVSYFAVKAEAKALGYIEGTYVNKDGSIGLKITEGGLMLDLSGKVSYTQQFFVGPVPAYWKIAIEAAVKLNLPLNFDQGRTYVPPCHFDLTLQLSVGAGVGLVGVATIGATGGATMHFIGDFPISPETLQIYGDVFIQIDYYLLGMEGNFLKLTSPAYYFYYNGLPITNGVPDGGGAGAGNLLPLNTELLQAMQETSTLTQAPRSYLDSPSSFTANGTAHGGPLFSLSGSNTLLTSSTIKSNTYTYSKPQLAALSDGTKVLVWVEDDGSTNRPVDSNRTALYYSVYTPATSLWSTPAIVEQDYTADFNPVLKVVDDKAMLVWMNANTVFESTGVSLSDVSAAMDISFAQLDATTGTFGTTLTITSDNDLDMLPDVTSVNGNPAVVWVQNTGSDIFCTSGVTSIVSAQYDGANWTVSELATALEAVDGLSATAINNTLNVFFSQDTDGSAATTADKEIFMISEGTVSQITNNTLTDTKPYYENGSLYWYSDGSISSLRLSTGATAADIIDMTADADHYQYISGTNGIDAIIYDAADGGNEMINNVYAIFNDGSGWGTPIQITNSTVNIASYDGMFLPDGTLAIASNERIIGNDSSLGQANLVIYSMTPSCDISISNVDYDSYTLVAGSALHMSADVQNNGASAVSNFEIKILDSVGTVLDTVNKAASLSSGGSTTLDFTYTLPENVIDCSLTVQILPLGATDRNTIDNKAACTLRPDDISVEEVSAQNQGTGCLVTARIVNRGLTTLTDVGLSVNANTSDGAVLDTSTISSIAPQGVAFISFEIPVQVKGSSVYIIAAEQANENILGNNSNLAVVQELSTGELTVFGAGLLYNAGTGTASVTIEADNTTGADCTATFIVAAYNSSGKLIGTTVLSGVALASLGSYSHTVTLNCGTLSGAVTVKIFTLASQQNLTPTIAPWCGVSG